MHWLADGYGHDTRITNIVDTREVWIILAVNPDGAEYDITRRPVPLLAQEPPAERRARPRSGPTSTATSAIAGAAADGRSTNPAAITYHGPVRLLGARDAQRPRLPREPGRQRPAADPDGDHVPRGRPARDVAVRLHLRQRPGRHDGRRPQRARDHGQAHGRRQRLQARAGERPVHHVRHDPRLRVRDVPDLRLHVRDVGRRLPGRLADPVRDRPEQGSGPVPDRAGLVPAGGARDADPRSRAAARSTTTSRSPAAGSSTPTGPTRPRPACGSAAIRSRRRPRPAKKQAGTRDVRPVRVHHRASPRAPRPTRTISTAGGRR